MKNMNVLVTGANGLTGHHLCQRLLQENAVVWALTRSVQPALLATMRNHPNFNILRGDITDREFVEDLFQRHHFEVVFHLAVERFFPGKDSRREPTSFQETSAYRTNYEGTLNLLQSAARSGSRLWIQSSAMMVFDITQPVHKPVDEQQAPAPVEPNGMSVHLAEQACHYVGRTTGLKYIILRYPGVYGTGKDSGAIAKFVYHCIKGKSEALVAPSDRAVDFLYVEDAVEANLLAGKKLLSSATNDSSEQNQDFSGRIYHIGSGAATSIAEVAHLIRRLTGARMEILDQPSGQLRRFYFDIKAARQDLDFQPRSLEAGLLTYIEKTKHLLKQPSL